MSSKSVKVGSLNKLDGMFNLSSTQVQSIVEAVLARGVDCPPSIWVEGSPGIGKTALFQAVADKLGVPLETVHVASKPMEDFGLPLPLADLSGDGTTTLRYMLPEWVPTQQQVDNQTLPEQGILLFDDCGQAEADIQKILADVCYARKLHGHDLPRKWLIAFTGNRLSDRAGVARRLTHFTNRMMILSYKVDIDAWFDWALGKLKAAQTPLERDAWAAVMAFIKQQPQKLYTFDPTKSAESGQLDQYASPRTWEMAANIIAADVPEELLPAALRGVLGDAIATEFCAFRSLVNDIGNPDDVIKDPLTAKVPSKIECQYYMVTALMARTKAKTIKPIIAYLSRPDGIAKDLVLMYAHTISQNLEYTKGEPTMAVEIANFARRLLGR